MKPKIDGTEFGSIVIDGDRIEHDVLIRLSGEVTKRKKKLSKAVYGTSHIVSLAEAEYIVEKGVERLIVGAGQSGMVRLSGEAADYLAKKGVAVDLAPTPEAIAHWNKAHGSVVGLFHVTC
ncbi:Mth938-like domain-containing protein [Zavarzinia sp.]|uniref:Mth938-like domain-containing protein n=1 Tax=Zavarzinia sp. TaxID=2027920 RepID=UPI003561E56F